MKRINTSRQTIAAAQRNCNYRPDGKIAQHVLESTVSVQGLTGQVIIRHAGRSFNVNGLQVRRGDKIILVASKFTGRYYVCTGGQWSTQDEAIIAKCRQMILQVAA